MNERTLDKYLKSSFAQKLYTAARLFLAFLFIWAGIAKLLEPDNFAVIIDEFNILPTRYVWKTAYLLPITEIIAGIALSFNVRGSLTVITGLMIFFIGIVGYGIWLGIDVDCGCFGMYDPETSLFGKLKPALFRDILLLLPIAYCYWFRRRNQMTRHSK